MARTRDQHGAHLCSYPRYRQCLNFSGKSLISTYWPSPTTPPTWEVKWSVAEVFLVQFAMREVRSIVDSPDTGETIPLPTVIVIKPRADVTAPQPPGNTIWMEKVPEKGVCYEY
ncbi:hypothetical protein ACRRTK_016264 [Alexandromys fortis]